MSRYKYPRKSWYKSRKHNGKCANCGKEIPDSLAFSYVDESNIAITRNSSYYCWKCYNEKYPNDRISIVYLLKHLGHEVEMEKDGLTIDGKKYSIQTDFEKEFNL